MDYPKTRAEAKATGAKYYFTGEPCKHGHVAPRKTKGACAECLKVEWEKANIARKDYFEAYNKSEKGKQNKREWYAVNKEQVIATAKARDTVTARKYKYAYKAKNRGLYRLHANLRRRRHREATPKWLTFEQKQQIKAIYVKAMELTVLMGEQYVVDHIAPLRGEDVCGLHVPWNLQVMTQAANLAKSNKTP